MRSITLQTSDNQIVSGDVIGLVNFAASAESDGGAAILIAGSIYSQGEGSFQSSYNPASLVFATSANDSLAASGKIKINHDGHILPMQNQLYDLGDTNYKFRNLYVQSIESETLTGDLDATIVVECRNNTGSTINAGTPVYVSGYYSSNGKALIAPAVGNNSAKMPAIGLLQSTLTDGSEGYVDTFGQSTGFDTSAYTVGDTVYVDPTGGLTDTRPTGVNELVQNMGRVLRSDASQGRVLVLGPGRTNDTPNSGNYEQLTVSNYSFPTSDGSADQVIKTDGAGNLSFTTVSTGGLSNIVEDTTPQLGGSLDAQNNSITDIDRATFYHDRIEIGSNTTALASGVSIGAEAGRYSWVAGHFGSPNEAAYAVNIGYQAGYASSGYYLELNDAISQMKLENICIGKQAGKSSSSSSCIAIGQEALKNRTYYSFLDIGLKFARSGIQYVTAIGYGAYGNDNSSYLDISNSVAVGNSAGYKASGTNCTSLGDSAGQGLIGTSNVSIGRSACYISPYESSLATSSEYNTCIGSYAGINISGSYNNILGHRACYQASGNNNLAIGVNALRGVVGSDNIEILTTGNATRSIIGTNDNKIHIENTIIGDTSSKLLAIGNVTSSDLTPDATLEIKPNATTDVGLIVQAATSHSASLQEWQNSSETKLLAVGPDGGLEIPSNTPSTTTNKLYNDGSNLKFGTNVIIDSNNVNTGLQYQPLGGGLNVTGLTTTEFAAATLVTESDAISSNDNDTTIPTSAAVKDYVDGQGFAPLASPTFTGTPAAPTAAAGTNTTQVATTAYVTTAISNLIDGAPTALDTLNELAAALNDDASAATTLTNLINTTSGNLRADIDLKLENIVEDTTPQLGGTLDANGNTIDMGTYVITDAKVGQWDTAYGWGDHSSAGYLTSETSHADVVVDGDFGSQGIMLRGASAGSYSILTDNSSNWNTAYGWGNHASAGYLTSVTFSDIAGAAVVTEAEGISSNDNDTTLPTSAAVRDYVDTQDAAISGYAEAISSGGGGISNVVEDTTPQLGGNLDTNHKELSFPGNIVLDSTFVEGFVSASGSVHIGERAAINSATDMFSDVMIGKGAGANADRYEQTGFLTFNYSNNVYIGRHAGSGSQQGYAINIGDGAGVGTDMTATSVNGLVGNIAIGQNACRNENRIGSYYGGNVAIGTSAMDTVYNTESAVGIGYFALYDSKVCGYSVAIGRAALSEARSVGSVAIGRSTLESTSGDYNTAIGYYAGYNLHGSNNIEIRAGSSQTTSILNGYDDKITIRGNSNSVLVGDLSSRLFAIGDVGVADITPDATLEVKPASATDTGLIVQAATSQSATLQEWQNSSETKLLAVGPDGGLEIPSATPSSTTNKLYNDGSNLIFGTDVIIDSTNVNAGLQYQPLAGGLNVTGLTTTEFAAATLVTAAEGIGSNNNDTTIPTSAAVKAYADSVAGGGGTPGGSDTQIQFNDGGSFGGDADLVWNKTTNALTITGSLNATTKSFLIDHPSKPGMKLQYASLEGPENGVYVRGTTDSGTITLPDYWRDLVHNSSITVTLTPVGQFQPLFVEQKSNREIRVGGVCGYYDYVVYGERKDVDKLEVEW